MGAPGNWSIHGFIEHPKGTGPRHLAIQGMHPLLPPSPRLTKRADEFIYVIHETANLLTKQAVPAYPNGTSPIIANVTSLAADAPTNATFAAAEILLPNPSGAFPQPYIYVSNRNIAGWADPRGDTIGIFEPTGLDVVAQVYTGLVQIRGMELGVGEAGEEYLVALGALSGGMVVYKRTEGGAALEEVARNSSAVARTTLVMLEC